MSYYPKNTDFLRHEKIACLRDENGAGAVLLVEALWARMYEQGGSIQLTRPLRLALSRESTIPVEGIERIIDAAIEIELLTKEDDGSIYAPGVDERIQEVVKERNRKRRNNAGITPEESRSNPGEPGDNAGSLSLSFSFSFSSLEEVKEGLETIRNQTPPAPDETPIKAGPELRCEFTLKELKRILKFFKSKELALPDVWRGIEILDSQLSKPKYAKQNRDHAACMTRWVYQKILEERTSEARHSRANGSTAPPNRPLSVTEHNEIFFKNLERKRYEQGTSD